MEQYAKPVEGQNDGQDTAAIHEGPLRDAKNCFFDPRMTRRDAENCFFIMARFDLPQHSHQSPTPADFLQS